MLHPKPYRTSSYSSLCLALAILALNLSCKKDEISEPSYSKVGIAKLQVNNFPSTNGGVFWDNPLNGNYPDVYFEITKAGTSDVLYAPDLVERHENVQPSGLPIYWETVGGTYFYALSDLSQKIDVDLWDYDYLTGDELIGSATIDFNNYAIGTNKYPSSITIANSSVSVKLDLVWMQ